MTGVNQRATDPVVVASGLRFFVDEMDSLGLRANGIFEPETLAFCEKTIRPGNTVVDVGANIGYYTVYFSRFVGAAGRVIAFEPDPFNFSLLQKNVAENGCNNAELHRFALSDQAGQSYLYLSDSNLGMHRMYPSVCCTDRAEGVQTIRFDETIPVDEVQFVKIDIEGYEYFALRGMEACLRNNDEVKIVSEFSPLSMLEAGYSPILLLEFLFGLDFLAYDLDGKSLDAEKLASHCRLFDQVERGEVIAEMQGKNIIEILDQAQRLLQRIGYARPLLEYIVFARRPALC